MARYRLRFQLQEVDLPPGETLIGRSLDCQVTIEDPLVSRQHARIIVSGDQASVEDLGSRNGVKVNGLTVRGMTALKDGDRLRIGTQDLVVARMEQETVDHARATGVLRVCANCRLPHPRELVACPNCAHVEEADEHTLSGSFGAQAQQSWGIQLLVEAVERALALGRMEDAERILRRATLQIEEALLGGNTDPGPDARQLSAVSRAACRISAERGNLFWASWALRTHQRLRAFPSKDVVDSLAALLGTVSGSLGDDIDALTATLHAQDRPPAPEEAQVLARLAELRQRARTADASQPGA